eukprot:5926456-Prymnesium_polylepis.1
MQPTLHMSIAVPYNCAPSSSSGGRYHSVITRLVYWRCWSVSYGRASPKSASFSWPSLLMS